MHAFNHPCIHLSVVIHTHKHTHMHSNVNWFTCIHLFHHSFMHAFNHPCIHLYVVIHEWNMYEWMHWFIPSFTNALIFSHNLFLVLILCSMEKRLERLPTTTLGLLLTAQDLNRDFGLSKEERDEQMELLKMLSLEELRNYVITRIYLHMQRFGNSSTTPLAQTTTLGVNTIYSPTQVAPPVVSPTPTSHHTIASRASRYGLGHVGKC